MICEKCKKNVATFHYTEVINGVKNEHHLCSECAAGTDVSYFSSIFDSDEDLSKLLSGILGSAGLFTDDTEDPSVHVQCPECKMTYGEFVKNSKFGCPTCYDVFGLLISDKIKKIQGSDRHVGKKPVAYGGEPDADNPVKQVDDSMSAEREIEILSKKMKEAVADEDYEEAAKLRDKIAELRKKGVSNA